VAAPLIVPKGTDEQKKEIAAIIRANDRLGMNVKWASDIKKEITSVYSAGRSTSFLSSDPRPSTIYQAPGK
jgi:hypothetical protein